MVGGEASKVVIKEEVLEELVTLVVGSWYWGGVGITSYI